MKNYSEPQVYLNYLTALFCTLTFIYLGISLVKKIPQALELYHENNTYPEDEIDKKLNAILDRALGKPVFGILQSIFPHIPRKNFKSDPSSLEDEFRTILNADRKSKYFFRNDKIKALINPLYSAYMRNVSSRIFCGATSSFQFKHTAILYAASSVDIITPLLLLMACPAKEATIYMVDNNSTIRESLAKLNDVLVNKSLPQEWPEKIIGRLYRQFYFLSEYDLNNSLQKSSPHLILALILQQLGIENITNSSGKLSFIFQERNLTFEFIHADITNLSSLNYLQEQINFQPYIYIAKASADLLHSAYLPALFKKLGLPNFCFISTERLNREFNKQLSLWISMNSRPSRQKVLQTQFIPNDCHERLEQIRHPFLLRLHQAIIEISRFKPGQEVTNYHLPRLHHPKILR